MINQDDKNRFIELRAQGLSFNNISKQLKISKPTLIKLSKELNHDINNLKEINKEELLEKFKLTSIHKLETMSLLHEKLKKEVLSRDLSKVPTLQLFKLYYENQNNINEVPLANCKFKESELMYLDESIVNWTS